MYYVYRVRGEDGGGTGTASFEHVKYRVQQQTAVLVCNVFHG